MTRFLKWLRKKEPEHITEGDIVEKPSLSIDLNAIWRDHTFRIAQEKMFEGMVNLQSSEDVFRSNTEWPPERYICGACGKHYNPLHKCANQRSDITMDFDTWCGEEFDPYDGTRHNCEPYGKHARREGMSKDTYFVRVWSYVSRPGRHEFDWDREALIWVEDISNPSFSKFMMIYPDKPNQAVAQQQGNEDWEGLVSDAYNVG